MVATSLQYHSTEVIWEVLRYYLNQISKSRKNEVFAIMVVREMDARKSSLVSNLQLLGSDVAKEGDGVQSETSRIAS